MIVVDTSALLAVLLDEPEADACMAALATEVRVLISAGTMTEALIVAGRRNLDLEMAALIDQLGLEVVPVTDAVARRAAEAYRKWGKGTHAAALNFGDCFAYEAAASRGARLLYVGEDFARTDVAPVI